SHARAPRLRGAGDCRVITTERTRLLRAVEITPKGQAADILVTPFGRPFALGRLRLELLPSGHAPGAAQLYVAVERALDDGVTPVVLAPALGAAEDVVALLAAAALPVRVHARIAAW